MGISPQMKNYLTDYLAWATSGVDDELGFSTLWALCGNIEPWALFRKNELNQQLDIGILDLYTELRQIFLSQGMDDGFPFGGTMRYGADRDSRTHHLNPRRIEWVRKQLS